MNCYLVIEKRTSFGEATSEEPLRQTVWSTREAARAAMKEESVRLTAESPDFDVEKPSEDFRRLRLGGTVVELEVQEYAFEDGKRD